MSAFIVSEKTMHQVVEAVLDRFDRHSSCRTFAGVSLTDPDGANQIGAVLYALNGRAIVARYGERDDMLAGIPAPYQFRYGSCRRTDRQTFLCHLHKAIACLVYQCAEGDVPEEPLYGELEALQHHLAEAIVSALPAWEKAAWDS